MLSRLIVRHNPGTETPLAPSSTEEGQEWLW